ncbi:MAG: sensor histidine kinase [Chitinophagaceae bacterium]|jgi:two-component system, NarL family, sensor kinase|nr:sensor histidine kinase [Chitinophagaceae bacterium]
MKHFTLLFLFLFAAGEFLMAQSNSIQIPENEIERVENIIDSFYHYASSGLAIKSNRLECNIPEHRQYLLQTENLNFPERALNINKEQKQTYIRLYALNKLATAFYDRKEYAKSTLYWEEALIISLQNDFTYEELHSIRPALNNNFFLAGDYLHAMKISTDGLAKSEMLKDTNRMIHFNNVIGYIHMKQKNFIQAEQYFNNELQLACFVNDRSSEAHALFNQADLALAQRKYDIAIVFLQNSQEAYQSSKSPYLFALSEREAYISNKLSEVYKQKADFQNALKYALISIKNIEEKKAGFNAYDRAGYYINGGAIYNSLQKPDSAILFLLAGMKIAQQITHREHMRDACEQLALAYAQKKKFDSAYIYHTLFSRIKDSINNENNLYEILQQEANLKIQQQQQFQKLAIEKQKLGRNIIIAVAIFSFIIIGFLYNRLQLRQKNRYQMQLNMQQNELFNSIAVIQDKERKRIAEDIHDSLGSLLSAAKLKLSSLKEEQTNSSNKESENWQVTFQLLDEASAELRNISHNIMPASLSKLGLVAALKNLISQMSSSSAIQMNFSAHDFKERINEATEMSIYRIVLELINNVVKHANPTKTTVQLIKYPDYINISVEDNGKGFDFESEMVSKKGIGLDNILSRVNYLKGKLDIDTSPGRGTTVIIDIPNPV